MHLFPSALAAGGSIWAHHTRFADPGFRCGPVRAQRRDTPVPRFDFAPMEHARPWYRNLNHAPGRLTGYSAKTLPGIREAIEEQRWQDAKRLIAAGALDTVTDRLDSACRLVLPTL